jgi:cysteine desulfurase
MMKVESHLYLDWAATAPPDHEIVNKVKEISLKFFANPSSIHRAGREAEDLLNDARKRFAVVLRCESDEIIFTAGGTEANNMVAYSMLQRRAGKKIISSGIEHASMYEPLKMLEQFGFKVKHVRAGANGFIDPESIRQMLDDKTALVVLMLVNNETGSLQPVRDVAEMLQSFARSRGSRPLLHTDAVQALGKIPLNLEELGVDSASFSAHKIGGPRGAGALFVRKNSFSNFLYRGGGQESGMRPGTENIAAICGLAMAAEKIKKTLDPELERSGNMMQYLITELKTIKQARIIPESRGIKNIHRFSPCILNVAFPPVPGEVLVRVLDEGGIYVSTGSACSSRKKDRFRIHDNMGIPPAISKSAVRISTGTGTQLSDLTKLIEVLKAEVPRLLKIAR